MFQQGQQIGNYTLIRKLGRGGFGEVWLAERRSEFVTTLFALKFPHREQIDFETIKHEAQLWAQANGHPNVLPIIEAATFDGQVVIVSEFAPDGSLEQFLNEKTLSPAEAIEMLIGILRGLEFLHSRNIIHRDIKPANILLQGDTPRLTDFGISRVMKETSNSVTIAGTPKFMAPEAFDGKRTAQTDIWAVGVILYLMLKGDLPFPQTETTELLGAIVFKEPEPLPVSVPSNLQNIVKKSLTKNPSERYQTSKDMREDLQRVLVGFQHPTMAQTEVLQIPTSNETILDTNLSNQTVTDVANINKIFPTQEPRKETVFHTPQNPVEITSPIQKDSVAANFKQVNVTSSNKSPKSTWKIGGIILGISAIGLISIIAVGIGIYSFISSKKTLIANNSNTSSTNNPPITDGRLIPFRKGNKWGYSDAQKRIHIPPQFESGAEPFSEDLALVLGSKSGYIDKTGKIVIQPDFEPAYSSSFKEGLARIKIGEKYGFIDKSGNIVIQPKYYSAESFSEGLAKVCYKPTNNDAVIFPDCGFVDKSGNEVIPLKYFYVSSFSEGLAPVVDKTTANKKVINGETYYYGKAVFIDKTGKIILKTDGDRALPFSEGLACVPSTIYPDKYIDKTGQVVFEVRTAQKGSFSEGLAPFTEYEGSGSNIKTKCGFMDKTGNIVIPLQYDSVGNFSEGLAAVESNKKVGFIDKTGKVIIPLKYEISTFDLKFKNGIVRVSTGDKSFYIGKDGTEYYEP